MYIQNRGKHDKDCDGKGNGTGRVKPRESTIEKEEYNRHRREKRGMGEEGRNIPNNTQS